MMGLGYHSLAEVVRMAQCLHFLKKERDERGRMKGPQMVMVLTLVVRLVVVEAVWSLLYEPRKRVAER